MLDEQHREVRRQPGDGVEQFGAFVTRDAGGRLVEQQHFRTGRQRERDLEKTLLAVGELAGWAETFAASRSEARISCASSTASR